MKRDGIRFATFSLIFGATIGIAFLMLENYIASELTALLREEVEDSCPCEFIVDELDVSLLTLTGVGKNARIIKDEKERLLVRRLEASFGFDKLLSDLKITVKDFKLIDVFVDGILPGSATFEFIDTLAEPKTPEEKAVKKLRARLQDLHLINAKFRQEISGGVLLGSGVTLDYLRNKDDDIDLTPYAEDIRFRPDADAQSTSYKLGELSGDLLIEDELITIREANLGDRNSWLRIKSTIAPKQGNKIQGSANYHIDKNAHPFAHYLNEDLKGSSTLAGTLLNPKIKADITSIKGKEVRTREPIRISNGKISGVIEYGREQLSLGALDAQNIGAKLSLGGTTASPQHTFRSTAAELSVADYTLNTPVELTISLREQISFLVQQKDSGNSKLLIQGKLKSGKEGYEITKGTLLSQDLRLFKQTEEHGARQQSLLISADGEMRGGFGARSLQADAELKVSSPQFAGGAALTGEATIKNGKLRSTLKNRSGSLKGTLTTDLVAKKTGTITMALTNFQPADYDKRLKCFETSAQGTYKFPLENFAQGFGSLTIDNLVAGCAPQQTKLAKSTTLPITEGDILFHKLSLVGPKTKLDIQGKIRSFETLDLKMNGSMLPSSLLPIFPEVDHLGGLINAQVTASGPVSDPILRGNITLQNGEISIESVGIDIEELEATLKIKNQTMSFTDTAGILNGGSFEIAGDIQPLSSNLSDLQISFSEIVFDPYPDLLVTLSGDLALAQNTEKDLTLKGNIYVDNAQIEKSFDLIALIQELPELLITPRKKDEEENKKNSDVPHIPLDLTVTADRNLFVITNLLGAEFGGDIHIGGTIAQPSLNGKLETLSGWFGLKDRRFEVTTGEVLFHPTYTEPHLELLGETYVRSRVGDNVLILIEAAGPVTSPTITLSSDRGLTQRELLSLLTSGSGLQGATAYAIDSEAARALELETRSAEGGTFYRRLVRFFKQLTRIDSLSLEPKTNSRRGQLEPTLIAEKKLLDYLTLVGQSFISSGGDQAVVALQYELTESTQVAATADTINSENNTTLGIDLKYTVLAKENPYITYDVSGNEFFSRRELLRQLKLTKATKILMEKTDQVEKALLQHYQDSGFFQVQVQLNCKEMKEYCRRLAIAIEEGPRSTVQEVTFEGDPLPYDFGDNIEQLFRNSPAKKVFLDESAGILTQSLRSEGYIATRVRARYETIPESDKKKLVLTTRLGSPVSFEFIGNTIFSPKDFLDTINLFSRRQPFGNNTIRILTRNIERMYKERGYLNITTSYTSQREAANDRLYYRVEINEGQKISVSDVTIVSKIYTEEELKALLLQSSYGRFYNQVFSPESVIDQQLRDNVSIIDALLEEQGYSQAEVIPDYEVNAETLTATISYTINEQRRLPVEGIQVQLAPQPFELPTIPLPPFSETKIGTFTNNLIATLRDYGYKDASFDTDLSDETNTLTIEVETGVRTAVSSIIIDGNRSISEETIREKIVLKPGDPWTEEKVQESRRALLKLGLFSRVSIEQIRVDEKHATMFVKVVERPLTTLEVGTGANSEFGAHLFGEMIDKSFFHDGRRIALRLDAFYDDSQSEISRGLASLSYFDPDFIDTSYSFAQDLRFQKIDLATFEYDLDRFSLSSSVTKNFYEEINLSLTHTILQDDLEEVTPGAILSELDTGTLDLSFVSLAASIDKRDQVLNPRKGYYAQVEALVSNEEILSDADYFSVQGQFSYIVPFLLRNRSFALAHNLRSGVSWTYNGTPDIPITQRYYLGGRTTLRGFRENSLGPKGDDGAVIGGDVLFQNNLELRYYPTDLTSFNLFFDSGNVFLQSRDIDIADFRTSVGVGVRYLSPIGPIGFDIGKPLNEQSGEPSLRFHFLVGTSF